MRMKNKIFLGVSGVKGVKAIVFLFLCLLMIHAAVGKLKKAMKQ